MQCLQLTRGDPPKASMKWYFNSTIALPEKGTTWTIDFVLGSSKTSYLKLSVILNSDDVLTLEGTYLVTLGSSTYTASRALYKSNNEGWVSSDYRTITFATPPTGTLLSWLKANATPQ